MNADESGYNMKYNPCKPQNLFALPSNNQVIKNTEYRMMNDEVKDICDNLLNLCHLRSNK